MRWPSSPPREASKSMQMVMGRLAIPAEERPVAADGLQLEGQEEQHGAEGGVDEQRHRVGCAERAVGEEPNGIIGCSSALLGEQEAC